MRRFASGAPIFRLTVACSVHLPCENSGYLDPRSCRKCRCPSGLGGRLCTRPKRTRSASACGALRRTASAVAEILEFGPSNGTCNYMLKAPEGARIQLHVESIHFLPSLPCTTNFLELKYGRDLGTTGARLCGDAAPPMPRIISRTNLVLVLFRSQSPLSRFRLTFSSDEPTTPLNVLSNSVALFAKFFRGFFAPSAASTSALPSPTDAESDEGALDYEIGYEAIEPQPSTTTSNAAPSIAASTTPPATTRPPSRRPQIAEGPIDEESDLLGSGFEELSESLLRTQPLLPLVDDDDRADEELLKVVARRRKPAKPQLFTTTTTTTNELSTTIEEASGRGVE